jgi:hypothetical protein
MELDKALQLAVIVAWEDLTKSNGARSVRVEYQCEAGSGSSVRLPDVDFFDSSKWGTVQEQTVFRLADPDP